MPRPADGPLPQVLSEFALSNSFLGRIVEVCLVTEDHQRTMEGLVRLGIGPFRVYTFDSGNTVDRTYAGEPADFSLTVCFATNNDLTFEIMQPLTGRIVMRDFLDQHGEGVHHLAFDCDGAPWEQRLTMFADRGFPQTQSGRWLGQNSFSFFDTEAATTTCFETYHSPTTSSSRSRKPGTRGRLPRPRQVTADRLHRAKVVVDDAVRKILRPPPMSSAWAPGQPWA